MKRGNTDIIDVKRGTSQVQKIYRGNTLVWQKVAANTLVIGEDILGLFKYFTVHNLSAVNSLQLRFTLTSHTITDGAQPSVATANGNTLTLNVPYTVSVTASQLGANKNSYNVHLEGLVSADDATIRCEVISADVDTLPALSFIDIHLIAKDTL